MTAELKLLQWERSGSYPPPGPSGGSVALQLTAGPGVKLGDWNPALNQCSDGTYLKVVWGINEVIDVKCLENWVIIAP